jgi:H+/gluconate symporter-like permease
MLSPFMSSLDGNSPPSGFNAEWLSFLAQSPIAIYVTILTSCYFHATAHKIDVDKSLESTQTKVKLIGSSYYFSFYSGMQEP